MSGKFQRPAVAGLAGRVANASVTPAANTIPKRDANGDLQMRAFAMTDLPAAGTAGRLAFVTDALKVGETTGGGTGVLAYDDGTNWRRSSDDTTLAL